MPLASLQPTATLAIRQGISWGLDQPTEDSAVLVTGTPSGHYIDIRFALSGPSTSGPLWAFAGTSKYTALSSPDTTTTGGWDQVIRGEWAHPIDSMGNFEGKDHADIITLQNGDQIETGVLEHPETGKPSQFKEYWTKPKDDAVFSPVVRAEHKERGEVKGMMIRVGRWAQAIRQLDGTVEVGRWKQINGEWKEDELSAQNEKDFPVDWLVQQRGEGETTLSGGKEWVIVESS